MSANAIGPFRVTIIIIKNLMSNLQIDFAVLRPREFHDVNDYFLVPDPNLSFVLLYATERLSFDIHVN